MAYRPEFEFSDDREPTVGVGHPLPFGC